MNVLSLFDGMSCGQIALERAGIHVDNYFAAEIDKYAISVTQSHYPNTVQLGDVNNWKKWKLPKINLLIGGSPCQGFSKAGHGLNFDDPRSKLFFVYCDILAVQYGRNPDLKFMLENVKMKKEWQEIITDRMKVEPVLIDSALVSAQSRQRLYWANFPIIQPEDKEIYLKDIIEDGVTDRQKSFCLDANYYKGGNPKSYAKNRRQLVFVKGLEEDRRLRDGKSFSRNFREGYRIYSANGKSPALSATPKGGQAGHSGLIQVGTDENIHGHDSVKRVYSSKGKSPTLTNMQGGHRQPKVAVDDLYYRKLTPLECERLQTVEDNWTSMVSNTQRYKMLGNGWTIDVISHIFKQLPIPANTSSSQL